MAELYRVVGRYSDAEPLYERSLQIRETQLGADHPDTATSFNNLAVLYQVMGRYSEAEPLYLQTLGIWTKSLAWLREAPHCTGKVSDGMKASE